MFVFSFFLLFTKIFRPVYLDLKYKSRILLMTFHRSQKLLTSFAGKASMLDSNCCSHFGFHMTDFSIIEHLKNLTLESCIINAGKGKVAKINRFLSQINWLVYDKPPCVFLKTSSYHWWQEFTLYFVVRGFLKKIILVLSQDFLKLTSTANRQW